MNKIVFLDRDGVINKYPGDFKYVTRKKDFKFLPGVKESIKKLNSFGYIIFIISNQAGVTKGIYSKKTLVDITQKMLREIKRNGGKIEKVLYCIHTEEQNCNCRKPKTGLIKQVLNKIGNYDKKKIFLIGDSIRDIKTGKNAKLRTILVLSGKEKIKNKQNWEVKPDFIANNLYNASEIILNQNKKS